MYLEIILIVTFYPNDCSQFENSEAIDFEKIASASSSFSTLSLLSSLPLPTSFIKVFPLPQKINRFHFHISDWNWVRTAANYAQFKNSVIMSKNESCKSGSVS